MVVELEAVGSHMHESAMKLFFCYVLIASHVVVPYSIVSLPMVWLEKCLPLKIRESFRFEFVFREEENSGFSKNRDFRREAQ